MRPVDIRAENFSAYPPQAQKMAISEVELLRQLPLGFLPLLLRELIAFDWKFPVEQRELTAQLQYLHSLSPAQLASEMKPFANLQLTSELEAQDWINAPARFSEQFSAHLWATHQIEAFRTASVAYVQRLNQANPPSKPALSRLTLIAMGEGVAENQYPLFRKLRAHGTYFSNVDTAEIRELFAEMVRRRSETAPEPFGHWWIEGGHPSSLPLGSTTRISYRALDEPRTRLVNKMRETMRPGGGGPEALRTLMAQMSPAEIGMDNAGSGGVLSRFQVSLLTEGSGTQLFSTTFVQWAARETLRRAQPLTLFTAYAPRQREESMQEMLSGSKQVPVPDPNGSLIDADMGAYYTWLNALRLPGASESHFVACFEGHREVMATGPAFQRGTQSAAATSIHKVLANIA